MAPLNDVLALVLGGGRGERLYPLTKMRAKPAVPIAGRYRLIDVPISNCLNSGVENIYIITQFNSVSLHRHIVQTYKFDSFSAGWVQILAAEQSPRSTDWYQGTADAVRKHLVEVLATRARDVLVLAGDHLYRMDYAEFLRTHRERGADLTVAVKPVGAREAPRFGILVSDTEGRIVTFREKPATAEALAGLESGSDPERPYMASMGIYVFRIEALIELLELGGQDFGRDLVPAAIDTHRVIAHPFEGFWVDIGTIRSFYETNLALAGPNPPFDFYDAAQPIYTHPRFLPGTRLVDGRFESVLFGDGCLLQDGVSIERCVVGLRSIIGQGVRLADTYMMGADFYETPAQRGANRREGRPDIGVGAGSSVQGAIIDKNARIGQNVVIRPHPADEVLETESYVIRDGLVIVIKSAVIPDNTTI
jgi:glucose-1-phosphate adenylyltransferase